MLDQDRLRAVETAATKGARPACAGRFQIQVTMEPLIFANFHESPFIKHDERHGMRYGHGLGRETEPIEIGSPFEQAQDKPSRSGEVLKQSNGICRLGLKGGSEGPGFGARTEMGWRYGLARPIQDPPLRGILPAHKQSAHVQIS